jgi:hypothetical protein
MRMSPLLAPYKFDKLLILIINYHFNLCYSYNNSYLTSLYLVKFSSKPGEIAMLSQDMALLRCRASISPVLARSAIFLYMEPRKWCPEEDSNLHGLAATAT